MPTRKRAGRTKAASRSGRKKRAKARLTTPVEILNNVREAFNLGARNKAVQPAEQNRLEEIFQETVGRFRQRVLTVSPGEDIWSNRDFKAYILKVARKIGRDAAQTDRAEISAAVLNASAVDVMLAENRTCTVRIEDGHVKVDGGSFHGPVCSDFLATQT